MRVSFTVGLVSGLYKWLFYLATGVKLGNGLDSKLKSCHNVQVFKKCVKEQYLQTYDLN